MNKKQGDKSVSSIVLSLIQADLKKPTTKVIRSIHDFMVGFLTGMLASLFNYFGWEIGKSRLGYQRNSDGGHSGYVITGYAAVFGLLFWFFMRGIVEGKDLPILWGLLKIMLCTNLIGLIYLMKDYISKKMSEAREIWNKQKEGKNAKVLQKPAG